MKKYIGLLTAAAILALAGCGEQPQTAPQPTAEGTAVIGLSAPSSGRYLFTDAWGCYEADQDIQQLIYGGGTVTITGEGAMVTDSGTLSAVFTRDEPNGARTYTFTINDGLCYSDGSPITAQDYVFSVLLQSSPAFAQLDGADISHYSHLVGWDEYASGESQVFTGVRLLANNKFSLTIKPEELPYYQELSLVQVYPYPVSILAPGAAISDDGGATMDVGADTLQETILDRNGYRYFPSVTAGPYSLTEITTEKGSPVYKLTANPHYNGSAAQVYPSIETLEIHPLDAASLTSMGEYDLISGISGIDEMSAAMRLVNSEDVQCNFYESAELSAILFGEEVSTSVRQAVAALLSDDECSDLLAGRWGTPITGLIPSGSAINAAYYSDLRRYSAQWYDLSLAEELLGDSGPTLSFYYDRSDRRGKTVAGLLESAAEQSGLITIEAEGLTTDQLIARQLSGDYEMLFFNGVFAPDATPWTGPDRLTGEELLAAADDLAHTPGAFSERYEEKWLAFQEIYQQTLPALGLCGYERCDLVGTRLRNYQNATAYEDWTSLILTADIVE